MKKDSMSYQLGLMVGEYIVLDSLPTLSTDMLRTKTVIPVSEELTKEWAEKDKKHTDLYWSKGENKEERTKLFYENLAWYRKNIEDEYLEPEITVLVPNVEPGNKKEFFKGLKDVLWDCDCSHYDDPSFDREYDEIFVRRGIKLIKS